MGSLKTQAWRRLLEQLEEEGVSFYLNGKLSEPREIIGRCSVSEEAVYMPDFVTDEQGNLQEVRYDEVKKW